MDCTEAQLTKEDLKRIISTGVGWKNFSKLKGPKVPRVTRGTPKKRQRVVDTLNKTVAGMRRLDAVQQISSTARPIQPVTSAEPAQVKELDWAHISFLKTLTRAKRTWQSIAVLSVICLISASATAGWLFWDRHAYKERHIYFLNRIQREHNQLVQQLSNKNEKLIAENAALKARDHLLPSIITPAEASAKQ